MYSHEIEDLLRIRKYILTNEEYLKICSTSPQIDHIKYNAYEDCLDIYTNDKHHFKIKIKKKTS